MTIGEALKKIRSELGLTQKEMCGDIMSRSYYARVESDKSYISANMLIQLLLIHKIDMNHFEKLVKKTYKPMYLVEEEVLNKKIGYAINIRDINRAEFYYDKILQLPKAKLLKIRSTVMVAYLNNNLSRIDSSLKNVLMKEFHKTEKWSMNMQSLKLLESTMILWEEERLDFFINQLLSNIKKNNVNMDYLLKIYLNIFNNYLFIYKKRHTTFDDMAPQVKDVVNYLCQLPSIEKMSLYKLIGNYYKAFFNYKVADSKEIEKIINQCGYRLTLFY
ncbi:helix-turn-helix domain-containing protein [Lactobacillus intestinalis]|uniref:helix-turn-helix domain-containing protein n=1 Tax=Lactobacillus intestinalis TaxID=151781 RepID=UPI0025AA23C6|nr:helix-turn-helix transcriptional regulator [Lactobacillus intestinalis]